MGNKDKIKLTEEQLAEKRHKEQYIVRQMIQLYCSRNHQHPKGEMCDECKALADYAEARSAHCPRMAEKTFCSNCTIHCYKPEMREKIRQVMRFSGPRILFYHPFMATWHVITSKQEKRRIRQQEKNAQPVLSGN